MRTRVLTRQLADCLWFPRSIILWNVVAGEKTVALNNHDGFIDTLAFSPDGKKLASGSVDFTVRGGTWRVAGSNFCSRPSSWLSRSLPTANSSFPGVPTATRVCGMLRLAW
ncbi:hypothetical protein IEO21_09065 [Rhodonia placenta]|uniref:Anaphase-promoting complex subunit 4 WD40 domain-containing protein n=1 Tax=Rhodonia placenta TaxID=104341 RepID=A0A8H7TYL3_9APHY|nr:hypothetical protein IEO21_09065 [Postia placenta]